MVQDSAETTRALGDADPGGSKPTVPGPGRLAGRYVVIEEVGRGGMGVVLRSYDPKLQREVALKFLRGSGSSEAVARLVREARAMAKVNHPNVVQVYDVDLEATDSVLIAMEYVEGTDLRQWIAASTRPWQDVLRTFVEAGRGLAAAHRVDLLHRDFKPANVIVGRSIVKVTDFGLARWAADEPSVESAVESAVGLAAQPATGVEVDQELTSPGSVMGTPAYMAPEQHEGQTLDARTDQYAFCVALWEGLTGARPFAAEPSELVRAKAAGPPPWPRDVTVPKSVVAALVRGLCARPDGRWATMDALLDALERSVRQRGRKRWAMLGAVAAVPAAALTVEMAAGADELCTGAQDQIARAWNEELASATQQRFANLGRSFATQAWARVKPALDDYGARWVKGHRDACEATRIRGTQSESMMDLRMRCLQRARVEMTAVAATLAEADDEIAGRADSLVRGLPNLDRCDDVVSLGADVEPPPPEHADAIERVSSLIAQSRTARTISRYDDARAAADQSVEIARPLQYAPLLAEALQERGRVLDLQQLRDDAVRSHLEALRLAMASGDWRLGVAASVSLAFVHGEEHRADAAEAFAEIARSLGPRTPDPKRAEGSALNSLGAMHMAAGNFAAAQEAFASAIAAYEESKGATDKTEGTRHNLGIALHEQGRYEEALEQHRLTLADAEARLGPDHPSTADAHGQVAQELFRLQRFDEGLAKSALASRISTAARGEGHSRTVALRINHAVGLALADRNEEAAEAFSILLEERRAKLGPNHTEVVTLQANLGTLLHTMGRLEEAQRHLATARDAWIRTLGEDHVQVASLSANLAQVYVDQQRYDEAIALLEPAWKRQQDASVPPRMKGTAAFGLGRALWESGRDRERANALVQRALELFEEAGPAGAEALAQARAWRNEHPE